MIEIRNLRKTYGSGDNLVTVLKDIDLKIESGELVILMGPSGSGKSTLLNLIGGLDRADEGEILIDGKNIAGLKPAELTEYRRERLGYIFQFYNLVPNLTAAENIATGRYLGKRPLDLDEIISLMGLSEHRKKFPSQLSGGQQQRCAIGRALAKNPELLLCDEPTGALDSRTSLEILQILEDIKKTYHTTILIVTHNPEIFELGDRKIEIRDGQITRNEKNDHPQKVSDLGGSL